MPGCSNVLPISKYVTANFEITYSLFLKNKITYYAARCTSRDIDYD